MAKRKINAAMILAAGEDAHLQTNDKVSHAKPIDGESFLELNVNDIKNNPMQPRIHIDEEELKDLARSIKLHGLIQPVAVIKVGQSDYILKAGQRRWLAHKQLGLEKIKAIVQEETILPKRESDKALFEIAVLENTQRDNLNPLELALSLRQAMDKNLYKNLEELSQALGKSKSYVSKVMKVLSLEEEIINDLGKNKSTNDIESLYEIQKIKEPKEQISLYFDFITKKLDRKALRELNKKEVSHAKVPYTFEGRAKKVKVVFDVSGLTDDKVKIIKDEIEEVLKKYF
ncbi:MAG: ParB/RepB/Spo0J family partition protein [Epsilonproteobacteria bacterium]|nr:ParB/RepB/Spo0J family partition protein [Campylobacterota bacterium]